MRELFAPGAGEETPRTCLECGLVRRYGAHGSCTTCWQRHPDRPFLAVTNLAARVEDPPAWLSEFVAYLAARHCVGRRCTMITAVGRLLADEHPNHPQAILERARRLGRSMGSLARGLEELFADRKLALPTGQAQRLATGRRRRRRTRATTPGGRRPAAGGRRILREHAALA